LEKIFFISDVHLGYGDAEVNRRKEIEFVRFLNHVYENGHKLFILGDLFDYWFEYRRAVPKGHVRTLGKLSEMSDSGIEIFYILGNHDFWVRDYFQDELGIRVFHDALNIELNGKNFHMIHGDGLSKNDPGYKLLKKIMRNRMNIFLYSLIHPDFGLWLARKSSEKSREHSSNRVYEESGMIEYARMKIEDGFDYVIMGHSHKPRIEKIEKGYYVNLGDWLGNFTYGIFEKNFEIRKWEFQR
jgi:UDP-2,3-diacylglucosamine hydrolase